jgi:Rrf2 family protein
MKLTRTSSYALHAVAHMAAKKQDRRVASHDIARACGIPERFLSKVLRSLVSARILLSIKGPQGGYSLARRPSDISMLAILEAVEGPIQVSVPFGQGETQIQLNRQLEAICRRCAEAVRVQLTNVTISELIAKK